VVACARTRKSFEVFYVARKGGAESVKPVQIVVGHYLSRSSLQTSGETSLRVILGVHLTSQTHLLAVVQTGYAAALLFGSRECRQEQGGENRDNRNDNQQLDQGKTMPV